MEESRQVLLRLPLRDRHALSSVIYDRENVSIEDVRDTLRRQYGLCPRDYWLKIGGRAVTDAHVFLPPSHAFPTLVHVNLRLVGGKGGFGSQLRAQGNKMSSKKRAGNYEACRDLSGQRIRSVNQTRIITEYLKKLPEQERKKQADMEAKMERALDAPHRKTFFTDVEYLKVSRELVDNVESAVQEALLKRAAERAGTSGDHAIANDDNDNDNIEGSGDASSSKAPKRTRFLHWEKDLYTDLDDGDGKEVDRPSSPPRKSGRTASSLAALPSASTSRPTRQRLATSVSNK